jgi:hypothetical protein
MAFNLPPTLPLNDLKILKLNAYRVEDYLEVACNSQEIKKEKLLLLFSIFLFLEAKKLPRTVPPRVHGSPRRKVLFNGGRNTRSGVWHEPLLLIVYMPVGAVNIELSGGFPSPSYPAVEPAYVLMI